MQLFVQQVVLGLLIGGVYVAVAIGFSLVWGILNIVAVALFAFGYALQRALINRVIRAPLFFTLLLTFGVNLVIVNALLVIFKSDFRSVTPSYSGSGFGVAGVEVPYIRLAALGMAVVVAAAVGWLLNRTRTGAAIQAVGADRDAARLVGIDLRHVYALTFAVAAACAGVA